MCNILCQVSLLLSLSFSQMIGFERKMYRKKIQQYLIKIGMYMLCRKIFKGNVHVCEMVHIISSLLILSIHNFHFSQKDKM